MGGSETSAGTRFQARVAAYVLAHMLAARPLGWFSDINDVPLWVAAETGTTGDDISVGVANPVGSIEVQVKHGLIGPKAVGKVLADIVAKPPAGALAETVIVVDQTTSDWIHGELARNLLSRRTGRGDALTASSKKLLAPFPSLTDRLTVRLVHLDDQDNADGQASMRIASERLADLAQEKVLWDVLVDQGHALAAGRLRISRDALIDLLDAKRLRLRRSTPEQFASDRLDEVKTFLASGEVDAAGALLQTLKPRIDVLPTDLRVRYLNSVGVVEYRRQRRDAARTAWHSALDIHPSYVPALCNLANLERESGDGSRALLLLDRVFAVDLESVSAWVQRLMAFDSLGKRDQAPPPPSHIAATSEYQTALAGIACEDHRWEDARTHSLAALAGGESTEGLLMRAMVLANAPKSSPLAEREEFEAANRVATQALDRIRSPVDPRRSFTLALRSEVRRRLGRNEGASADLAEAGEGPHFEPNQARLKAMEHARADRPSSALAVLEGSRVETEPVLLALRAEIRVMLDDENGARSDFAKARALVNAGGISTEDRLAVATLAVEFDEPGVADEAIAPLATSTIPRVLATRGLVAFAKQDWELGKRLFREAIATAGVGEQQDLTRMALTRLAVSNQWNEVALWVTEFDLKSDAEGARRLARALSETKRYAELDQLARDLERLTPIPRWVHQLHWHIAELTEDPERGLRAVLAIRASSDTSSELVLAEARYLLMLRRLPEASTALDVLLPLADTLTPRDLVIAAEIAGALERHSIADTLAFLAYRRAPLDAVVAQALVRRLRPRDARAESPKVVAVDTAATLVDEASGTERTVIVLDRADADMMRDEYVPTHRMAQLVLGKGVGDVVAVDPGSPFEHTYRIKEILPAWVPAFRDLLEHAEERFPDVPFIRRIHLGTGSSAPHLGKVMQIAHDRATFARELMDHYSRGVIPLAMVGEALRAPVAEVIDAITAPTSTEALYAVEGIDKEFTAALSAAGDAEAFVVTLDALLDLDFFELLDTLKANGAPLIAPRSLTWRLAELEADARAALTHGRMSLGIGGNGLLTPDIAPREFLVRTHARYARLQSWVSAHVVLEPRPLAAIEREQLSQYAGLRQAIGDVALGALDLAAGGGAVLLTDDLFLRRLGALELKCRGSSVVTLWEAFADKGLLSADDRLQMRIKGIRHRYNFVPVDAATLVAAVSNGNDPYDLTRLTLERCTAKHVSFQIAQAVVAQACRALALASPQQMTPPAFARLAIEVLAKRWNRREVVRKLLHNLQITLALLPTIRDAIAAEIAADEVAHES